MATVDPIYRAEKIIKRFSIGEKRETEILHGIDATVDQGEFVMLIGPSGCGKSTFMYTLFGLEPPTAGKVWYRNQDLFSLSENERTRLRGKKIAMVHQQSIWIKALTVRENVAFPLFLDRVNRKIALERAGKMLDVLHLNHLADHHPHELSVGEQQRCALMRALIPNPEIIFADEPTGNLDTDASTVVMELLKKIHAQLGKTIILVTHEMRHLSYASKIISLLDGKISNIEIKSPPVSKTDESDILEIISSWKLSPSENEAPVVASASSVETPATRVTK